MFISVKDVHAYSKEHSLYGGPDIDVIRVLINVLKFLTFYSLSPQIRWLFIKIWT